nr:phage terminase small subunit [uncultured Merdimonas sp.]
MPKQRSPDSYKAEEMYKQGMKLVEIASQLNISEGTVRSWKNRYNFDGKSTATLQKNNRNVAKRKPGAPKGNKNAVGHGAPKGNQNAVKHGLFSRYLPEDTREIFYSLDSVDPLDLLWDQIKLAYTAIMRAQQIMHVRDQDDKTIEKVGDSKGNIISEKWEVQQAWDKQASFLQAQAKAQKELTTMIKQYEELLHKNWDLATKEQKARIRQLKAKTEQIQGADQNPIEDKVKKLFDAIGGALDESE